LHIIFNVKPSSTTSHTHTHTHTHHVQHTEYKTLTDDTHSQDDSYRGASPSGWRRFTRLCS